MLVLIFCWCLKCIDNQWKCVQKEVEIYVLNYSIPNQPNTFHRFVFDLREKNSMLGCINNTPLLFLDGSHLHVRQLKFKNDGIGALFLGAIPGAFFLSYLQNHWHEKVKIFFLEKFLMQILIMKPRFSYHQQFYRQKPKQCFGGFLSLVPQIIMTIYISFLPSIT